MSSRALRRAQREMEEKRLAQQQEQDGAESEEEEIMEGSKSKASIFALLHADGEDQDEDQDNEEGAEDEATEPEPKVKSNAIELLPSSRTANTSKRKKKGRKSRGGKRGASEKAATHSNLDAQLDEIDRALRTIAVTATKPSATGSAPYVANPETEETCRLLAIDSQNLHAANEMRRLFGRVALEDRPEVAEAGQGRRRRGGAQQEMTGRNAPGGGRGLTGLALRRNIFVQGKEEWPRATTGGLGMEVVEKSDDGIVEYRFVHSRAYEDVQRQFDICVAAMDPQRMMQLLHNNPYHISTLLQVSEIFKQQREPATSGDLLERALFSFGRAVHSTFSSNLAQGKARLDFRRPENREFWLAAWRYITNLGQRATWRTAYEWAKLLLSLDPENDPYCVGLVLDQLAIRARQAQSFLDLSHSKLFASEWEDLANIQISKSLAYSHMKEPKLSREALTLAIHRYPWVIARLFQELGIDHVPPSIWGRQPRTDAEKLHSELYATRAKDIWNTPEATSLLVEVASSLPAQPAEPPVVEAPITLNEARHVYLTDIPALLGLIPTSFTQRISSSSDPLLPPDNLASYATARSALYPSQSGRRPLNALNDILQEFNSLHTFFQNIFPWVQAGNPTDPDAPLVDPETGVVVTAEEVRRRIAGAGMDTRMLLQQGERMRELQRAIGELEDEQERAGRLSDGELEARARAGGVDEDIVDGVLRGDEGGEGLGEDRSAGGAQGEDNTTGRRARDIVEGQHG